MTTNLSESKLQAQCFKWLWNEYPQTRRCFFAIPNGGTRNPREAATMKATGVVAGVPDCCFVWRHNTYFFEFKTEIGKLSKEQENVIEAFRVQGIKTYVINNFESFKHTLESYFHLAKD